MMARGRKIPSMVGGKKQGRKENHDWEKEG